MMLKLNATLHDSIVLSEQQSGQAVIEQVQQSDAPAKKGSLPFASLFKQVSHALYLWMD
jgi:hypothetical protein